MAIRSWRQVIHWRQRDAAAPPVAAGKATLDRDRNPDVKPRYFMPGAFDPRRKWVPTPGFASRINELEQAGHYRTAIEEILKMLDSDPANQEALWLAASILSSGRSKELAAAEPLSETYLLDRRLNPVWAVCNRCAASWVPDPVGFDFAGRIVLNPVGAQCLNCGYTLCHECLAQAGVGHGGSSSNACPHGCGVHLSVPVYPTGRKDRQLTRRRQRVTHVYLFREGPIPPDSHYAHEILGICSPDALERNPEIVSIALKNRPEDIAATAIAHMMVMGKLASSEVTTDMILNGEGGTFTDTVNNWRVYVVKLYGQS